MAAGSATSISSATSILSATSSATLSVGARRSVSVSASVAAELTAHAEDATNDGTSWNQFDPSSTVSYDTPSASKGAALRYYMDDVSEIFKEHLSGQVLTLRATVVEADQLSPPTYEGSSCVYLLILRRENQPDTIYIGETESISQRLQQHR